MAKKMIFPHSIQVYQSDWSPRISAKARRMSKRRQMIWVKRRLEKLWRQCLTQPASMVYTRATTTATRTE